jgi:hypothetical protein
LFSFGADPSADEIKKVLSDQASDWYKTWVSSNGSPGTYPSALATIDVAGSTPLLATGIFDPTGAFPNVTLPAQPQLQDLLNVLIQQAAGSVPPDPTGLLLAASMFAQMPPPVPPIPQIPVFPGVQPSSGAPGAPLSAGIPSTSPQVPVPIPTPAYPGGPSVVTNAAALAQAAVFLAPVQAALNFIGQYSDPSKAVALLNPVALPKEVLQLVLSTLMSGMGTAIGVDFSGPTVPMIPKTLVATMVVLAKNIAVSTVVCGISQILGTGVISSGLAKTNGLV